MQLELLILLAVEYDSSKECASVVYYILRSLVQEKLKAINSHKVGVRHQYLHMYLFRFRKDIEIYL